MQRSDDAPGSGVGLSAGRARIRHDDAVAFLASHPSVDVHAHPGGAFRLPWERLALRLDEGRMDRRLAQMREGNLTAVSIATVPDASSLGFAKWGLRAIRPLWEGEGYGNLLAQWAAIRRRSESGALLHLTEPEQILQAQAAGRRAVLGTVEGADFLEGGLERLEEIHALGMRSMQLLHYTLNDLGDIQTEPPRHGGLTSDGREVVRTLNRLGLIVDVAHATCETCRGVLEASYQPVLLSHTMTGSRHPRQITAGHARLIAGAGGMVGAWCIWGRRIGIARSVDIVRRLVDAAGSDHVRIGTDVDGFPLYLGQYRHWAGLMQGLLDGGFTRGETGKILGGNFLRLFRAVRAAWAGGVGGP